jgi:hypothetical protein
MLSCLKILPGTMESRTDRPHLEDMISSRITGSNRLGISPLPEDAKTSSFRNVVYSSNLELWSKGKAHKPNDSKYGSCLGLLKPSLWSSDQSSWLQIQRSGLDSRPLLIF